MAWRSDVAGFLSEAFSKRKVKEFLSCHGGENAEVAFKSPNEKRSLQKCVYFLHNLADALDTEKVNPSFEMQ